MPGSLRELPALFLCKTDRQRGDLEAIPGWLFFTWNDDAEGAGATGKGLAFHLIGEDHYPIREANIVLAHRSLSPEYTSHFPFRTLSYLTAFHLSILPYLSHNVPPIGRGLLMCLPNGNTSCRQRANMHIHLTHSST